MLSASLNKTFPFFLPSFLPDRIVHTIGFVKAVVATGRKGFHLIFADSDEINFDISFMRMVGVFFLHLRNKISI